MRLLFCGDVVGQAGRHVLYDELPRLRRELELDFVVANGENAAGGFGITAAICEEFYDAGVDVITTGNHVWDQREFVTHFARDDRVLRPHNYPPGTPGTGARVYTTQRGEKVLVANVMLRLFMDPLDDPFACIDGVLGEHELGANVDAVMVDMHGEATSEKQAFGHFLDGRVSLVVGTHSHVPTADTRLLDGGTAYQTDAGMCGDYDSVIGMIKQQSLDRFLKKMPTGRLEPATGEATLAAVYLETDDRSGLARRVAPLRLGGRLAEHWPI